MTDMRAAWAEVADDLERLALKLRLHFEQVEPTPAARENVREAVCRLAAEAESAFAAIGNAVEDDVVRDDVRATATAFGEAFVTTFAELGHDVSDAVRERVGR